MKSSLPFTKMHGLGNSYVYIDCRLHDLQEEEIPELAQFLSSPSRGIGSDGIILICLSEKADLKMRIFNKDGSEGKNCGNGLRCVAAYAHHNGIIAHKTLSIETLSGIVFATICHTNQNQTQVSVNMGRPRLLRKEIPMIGPENDTIIAESFQLNSENLSLTAVSMGNPHAVFFVAGSKGSKHDLHLSLGPKIENDKRFPEKINVEFVTVESPHSLRCRVWERGSGATQACGTGACASAVAAILNGHSAKGHNIDVHLDGGCLQVCWKEDGDVWMAGPAQTVAAGVIFIPQSL